MLHFRKYLTNSQKTFFEFFKFSERWWRCLLWVNSQKLFLAERWWRWLLWLKISRAQIFWLCNGNVTTFPTSRKYKNFNFSLYNVPAEMLYFRKYLTNPQKLFLAESWWRWLSWVKIARAQIFSFCNGNVTTFPTSRKCKNFNSSLYTVPAEKLYLHTYLTNFQKLSFGCKITNVAILVENFKGSGIWVLQWQRYNVSNIQKM